MRPADQTEIKLDGTELVLRPTLRAATHLERKHGFDKLLTEIADGSLSTMADVVRHSSDRADLLAALDGVALCDVMPSLVDSISRHVLALAGVDPDNAKPAADSGERMTFADYHAKLFRLATGWLGWTPEAAWNATPAEILEGYNGHLEMLRAVHGGSDPDATPETPEQAVIDRDGLSALKAMQGAM